MKKNVNVSKVAQKCINVLMMAIMLIALTTSCREKKSIIDDDDDEPNIENPYEEVNNWILENMEIYYLWNRQIPSKTDNTLSPDAYFESLLYRDDRFSWIQKDYVELINSLSGVNTEAGYDFTLMRLSSNNSDVIGCITYIKPGTPAETIGLKRGDYFLEINGTQMTLDNYSSLIGEMSKPHTLGLAVISGNTIMNVKNVSLQVIEDYPENPILLDTVYDISDKKIGYFVYNFFAPDSGDGSVAYEKELNDIFAQFKETQINELIVDLRYNGGGAVSTTEALASMISGRGENDLFYIMEYNSLLHGYFSAEEGANYNKSYFINNIAERIPINKLSGLSTVYFIVTGNSASASELLINGLKPYMNKIVLVGETTYGKNVASITIYEKDKEKQKTNKWGMQPIVIRMSNAVGFSDYGNGFTPDIEVSEFDGEDLILKPLGDTAEIMLKTTLNAIFGADTKVVTTKQFGNKPIFVGSAMDRTPARRNQYITLKDLAIKKE
jgi:C-terminal processing protease CtpA/Prc